MSIIPRTTRVRPQYKVLFALILTGLAGCEHQSQLLAPHADQGQLEQLRKLGFDPTHAVDKGDYYLVEGDIVVRKAALTITAVDTGKHPSVRPSKQAAITSLPSATVVSNINVDFSQISSDTAWLSAAREALSNWNGVVGTTLHFVESSPAEIVFKLTSLGCTNGAVAEFPTGNPTAVGSTVWLNSDSQWCLHSGSITPSHAQKVYAATHELGHTLGLRHTNWYLLSEPISGPANYPDGTSQNVSGANHIYGTPLCDTSSSCDSQSVMNGGTLGVGWGGFSNYDVLAIQTLYPVQLNGLVVASYPVNLTWDPTPGATSYSVYLYYEQYTTYQDGSSAWQPYTEFRGTTTSTSYYEGESYTGTDDCDTATFRCSVVISVYANFASGGQSAPGSVSPLVAN